MQGRGWFKGPAVRDPANLRLNKSG